MNAVLRHCLFLTLLSWLPSQSAWADDFRIVHEYFDPAGVSVTAPRQSAAPADQSLPEPAAPQPSDDSQASRERSAAPPTQNGQSGQRATASLDEDTNREGVLSYFQVFQPSIAPHKRLAALDQVLVDEQGRYRMGVRDSTLRSLAVADSGPAEERDRFTASLVFEVGSGDDVFAIPSVSPEARILEVRSNPPLDVQFWRDGADNFFVSFNGEGAVRLAFATDAASTYFALGSIPEGLSLRQVKELFALPELPEQAARAARSAVKTIGIKPRRDSFEQALFAMVAYFRAFDAEPLDTAKSTGDAYLDIVRQQRGVCRHRAFAFVITAQYLGIPSRYVFNEAHAFVEVMIPRGGWTRIDLGGAAEGLEIHGDADSVRYQARQPSVLDDTWPERHENPEAQAGFDSVEYRTEADHSSASGRAEDDSASAASGHLEDGNERAASSHFEDDGAPPWEPAAFDAGTIAEPNPAHSLAPSEPVQADRVATQLLVTLHPSAALRGEQIELAGLLTERERNAAVPGATLYIMASAQARPNAPPQILGITESSAIGTFVVFVEIPPTLPLGAWDVFVYYPGDERWSSCRSH
jgi:hypothetical protein